MARTANPKTLARMITALRTARHALAVRLAAIEETFVSLGISAGHGTHDAGAAKKAPGAKRGRPPGRPAGSGAGATAGKKTGGRRRRRRGSFEKSGEESVLAFVQANGEPNAAEVNKHWQGEGRGGKADNALSKLVKAGLLKRVEVSGERGGRYTAK